MANLVELENVSKFYGAQQALGPLTLTVPSTSVGLLGPNGAGKSTLIRLLLGMVPPTSGTVRVLGEDVSRKNTSLRRRIGYAPEGDAHFPALTGVEAVGLAGRLVGMGSADALQRAHQVLDYVELGEERYRLVEKYSTGMRQRLKLAQALVHDPELLILDEPTEGVDPEGRAHILGLIRELEKEHGLKTLISSHLLHDVEQLTEYAVVLNEGRAAAQGPLSELKSLPTKAFLVRTTGSMEPLMERLGAAGITFEPMLPNLRVNTDDPHQILRAASECGLVVRHIAPLELTLEEAFQQAVAPTSVGVTTSA
ncbi:MAG: ABC transporter ATP-binding protein [Euryarchaeota archaeon]|nr:ABC transporter ATP-binding protein [Euryarchaeota archaeon]